MLKNEQQIIKRCKKNDSLAQSELYNYYAPKMYGICLRYVRLREEANDILQDSFVKAFEKMEEYKFIGSFEGWLKRLVVNTAINYYQAHIKSSITNIEYLDSEQYDNDVDNATISFMSHKELLKTIQELDSCYRFVFNLHVIEGYSHKEISGMLNIPEGTSKSHLLRAKRILQNKIIKLKNLDYERFK